MRALGSPVDRLVAVYALLSGVALLFAYRPAAWPVIALLHGAAAFVGFGAYPARRVWNRLAVRAPHVARFLGHWYPLLLVPLLYTELAVLNQAVHAGAYFDTLIMHWEAAIFGGQPSRAWAEAMPFLWLSEPLHAAYLSYYVIIYGPPLALYVTRRDADLEHAIFTLMAVFFAHYLFFIYFPVQGPRYLFPPHAGGIEGGFFYALTHRLLETGSSQGAAFPSSHVGVAAAQVVIVARLAPRWAVPLAVVSGGLAAGAVYGGFHFATDAIAGLILGCAIALVTPRLIPRRGRPRPTATA